MPRDSCLRRNDGSIGNDGALHISGHCELSEAISRHTRIPSPSRERARVRVAQKLPLIPAFAGTGSDLLPEGEKEL